MNKTYQEILGSSGSLVVANTGGCYLTKKVLHHVRGDISSVSWLKDGELDREGGPAFIQYRERRVFPGDTRTFDQLKRDGSVYWERWERHGNLHRDDGPADIEYRGGAGDSIHEKIWARAGKRHRDNGPAFIRYHPGHVFPGDLRNLEQLRREGAVLWEQWFRDGKRHRYDGPADIEYHTDGSIYEKIWARDGKKHRSDGPAAIRHRKGKVFPGDTRTLEELVIDGAVDYKAWYLNDKKVSSLSRKKVSHE